MKLLSLVILIGAVRAWIAPIGLQRRKVTKSMRTIQVKMSTTVSKPNVVTPKRAPGSPDKKTKGGGGGGKKHQLLLFDDPVNTREYVSKVLCTKIGLAEAEAYEVMMTAHTSSCAVVGIYTLERAEFYLKVMKDAGLVAAIKPVDDSSS